MSKRYKVERDPYGFPIAISDEDSWVLHLDRGSSRNEDNAELIVARLNEHERLKRLVKYAESYGDHS